MNGLSKILAVVAVLCVLGSVFHHFQDNATSVSPVAGVAAPKQANPAIKQADTPHSSSIQEQTNEAISQSLIYPGRAVLDSLKIGYEIFRINPDGNFVALPLPPGTAFQTTLLLSPEGHRALSMAVPSEKCEAHVDVGIYRLDEEAPIFTGSIFPGVKKEQLLVDFDKTKVSSPFVVTLKMARNAQNNWFCNIEMSWRNS